MDHEDDQDDDLEFWSLSGDCTGERGLIQLLPRTDPRMRARRLCLNLHGLKAADTVTGAVARRCLDAFLVTPPATATVWPPAGSTAIVDRMHDLLGPLPARATWAPPPDGAPVVRDRAVIVPATPIESDEEAELYGEAVGRALAAARLPVESARRTAQAVVELTENALTTRAVGALAPILSVALDPARTVIGVTVLGDPPLLASPGDAVAFLDEALTESRRRKGGWQRMSSKPGVRLDLAIGAARVSLEATGLQRGTGSAVDALSATWTLSLGIK